MRGHRLFVGITLVSCTIIALISFVVPHAHAQSAMETGALVISAGIDDGVAIPLFEESHPSVNIKIVSTSQNYSDLAASFLNGDTGVDVYRLRSNLGILRPLREKGFFYDLSESDDVASFNKTLDPVYRTVLSEAEKLFGVPSFIIFEYPFVYNQSIADDIGLTAEELPDNLLDLLKFVNQWDDQYGDEYPGYSPFCASNASSYALLDRNPYIGLVLEMYKDTMVASGASLRYDADLFRALLREVEPWTHPVPVEDAPSPENCLFLSEQVPSNSIFAWCEAGTLCEMPLSENMPFVQAFEMECVAINPLTTNAASALELAACYVRDCQPELLRILNSSIIEPYQRPEYGAHLQELKEIREQLMLDERNANADDKSEIRDRLELFDEIIQYELDHPYSISLTAMDAYRSHISPYLVPRGEGIYESEECYAETMSYTKQWLDGLITIDEYVQKLDAFLLMVEREAL